MSLKLTIAPFYSTNSLKLVIIKEAVLVLHS